MVRLIVLISFIIVSTVYVDSSRNDDRGNEKIKGERQACIRYVVFFGSG